MPVDPQTAALPAARLDGKVVWIIGAGSGIGAACALWLARAGAHVVLTGRRRERLEAVAAAIAAEGGSGETAPCDTTDGAAVTEVARGAVERLGRIDALVNCAGVNVAERSWRELSPRTIDTLVDGNLKNAYYATAAVLPGMRDRKDGMLIHVSSWAGRFPSRTSGSAYAAAKSALIVMSQTINLEECQNGIRSTVICPADVATELLAKRAVPPTAAEATAMLQPQDLAELVVFILTRPPHICLNEIVLSPTRNRNYIAAPAS